MIPSMEIRFPCVSLSVIGLHFLVRGRMEMRFSSFASQEAVFRKKSLLPYKLKNWLLAKSESPTTTRCAFFADAGDSDF